jgi:glycosyltransferase involved in cell wall biosynthesis
VRTFPGVQTRLDVIPEAPAPNMIRVEDDTFSNNIRRDLKLPDRYILFLGTLEPRKNLPAFLKAYASIAHRIPQDIVLTGRMGWLSDQLHEVLGNIDVRDRIHLTGYVEDRQLPALISMAEIMAYPSLYEGFGLPVVEAMACGTPVLTSSVTSLPEAAGGAALLADPTSVTDMAEKLLLLANDSELRDNLAQKGLKRASKLSWEKTALATLETCRKALE